MKTFLFDKSEERAHAVRVCEMKLCEAVDDYFSCMGEMHKASVREQAQKAYEEVVHRWQDLSDLRYDPKEHWDLNFDDYDQDIEVVYGKDN